MTLPVLAIGDLCVDQILGDFTALPDWGQEVEYSTSDQRLGGNIGNFAVAAQALGLPLTCVGPIGTDENGKWVKARVSELGYDTEYLEEYAQQPTCLTTALLRSDGERLFLTNPGVLAKLEQMIAAFHPPAADAALFTGWCQPPRVSPKSLQTCFDRLRAHSTRIYFDLSWSEESWRQPDQIISVLSQVDVAIMNNDEATALTGQIDPLLATRTLFTPDNQPALLVIKCGKHGAILLEKNESPLRIRGGQASADSHTVGAGDTFNAALLYALETEQLSPAQAVQFACDFAAYAIGAGRSQKLSIDTFQEQRRRA